MIVRQMQPPPARARHRLFRTALLLAALPAAPLTAQGPDLVRFERFTLPNGLQVVLAPDHTTQVAAVHTWYLAGSRDEPLDRAGMARLFERLMFSGSARVPSGGHAALIEQNGGRVDAAVDDDVSSYTETVASNRLPQALWLEAERMSGIVINDTTVAQARAGLTDDLRTRVADAPYAGAIMEGAAALYDSLACGYGHPPVGRLPTIQAITTADATRFFATRYRPGNARLAVTGDFDPVATRELITRYFGDIPAGLAPPPFACPLSPLTPRTLRFTDRQAARAAAGLFFRLPPHDHADSPALELLGIVLGRGQGGRLATTLTRELGAAAAVQAGILGTRQGPGAFAMFAIAGPGIAGDSLATLLAAQAAWAASPGLTEADLTRARNIYLATAVSARERPADVADALLHALVFHGSADSANTEPARVLAVTLADLHRVAGQWLRPASAVTLVVTPEGGS